MQTPYMSQKEKLSYFPVSTVSQPSWIDGFTLMGEIGNKQFMMKKCA